MNLLIGMLVDQFDVSKLQPIIGDSKYFAFHFFLSRDFDGERTFFANQNGILQYQMHD